MTIMEWTLSASLVMFVLAGLAFGWRYANSRMRDLDSAARNAEAEFEMSVFGAGPPVHRSAERERLSGANDQAEPWMREIAAPGPSASPPDRIEAAIETAIAHTATTSPAHAILQKLQIAGQAVDSGEAVLAPGATQPALAVRLRNQKTLLIVSEEAERDWLDGQSARYDYICVAGPAGARVSRRFEDFLADQMFT